MIRVFPRKTKATPIDDKVYFSGPPHPLWTMDDTEVFVSCTFTYDKEKAEKLADKWWMAGYNVKIGGPAYDDPGGEFVPGRFLKYGYTITSRGCNNKCWFCYVWKREGSTRELPIRDGWIVQDNNLLQCSEKHIRSVFEMLKRQPEKARFTGGLEAKLLKDWHVGLLVDLKPCLFFFAYDTPDDYEPIVLAARKVLEAGFTRAEAMCYVLIGYPGDTLGKAESRCESVKRLGISPFAMLYQDDKGIKKTEKSWKEFQRCWCRQSIVWSS